MWDIRNEQLAAWGDDVVLLGINVEGSEVGIDYINQTYPEVPVPVLQDTDEVRAFWNSGASPFYVYILDGERNVRYAHYRLSFDGDEQERAIQEINDVLGR